MIEGSNDSNKPIIPKIDVSPAKVTSMNPEAIESKLTKIEENKLNEVLDNNIEEIEENDKINTNVMEEIFSENIDSILNEIKNYEFLKNDETVDKIKLFMNEKNRLINNQNNLFAQITKIETESDDLLNLNQHIEKENSELKIELNTLETNHLENLKNLEKLENKIRNEKISLEKIDKVSQQIKRKEELKQSISQFKTECLEEKAEFEKTLENLEKRQNKLNDSSNLAMFEEIDQNYKAEYNNLILRKEDLFQQNKVINVLTRKVQVFPSKLELLQYQKRFQELYDQIYNISENSKKIMYDLNSKEEVKKLLNQKLDVFIQLRDVHKACKTKKDKEGFKESLTNVKNSLSESLIKSTENLRNFNDQIETLNNKLSTLKQYESAYMKLIKEYNKEYNVYNRNHK